MSTALVVLAAAVGIVVGGATPARADCPMPGADEASFQNREECRHTYVVDPGVGALMSRSQLLAHADYYTSKGFSPNFLWYSVETSLEVTNDGRRWTFCKTEAPDPCPDHLLDDAAIRTSFTQDAFLSVFRFGEAFVAKVCGNFSVVQVETPVPTVKGVKYHDLDFDGTRDADEPSLQGWTMNLRLEQSHVGQGAVDDLTTTTGPDGSYTFELLGRGPGIYSVTESGPAGWTNTTPTTQFVAVAAGIGDGTVAGPSFGNVQEADVAKVSFGLVDPPTRFEKGQWHNLTVRAVVRNDGPTPAVVVEDVLTVSGPADCDVRPNQQAVRRRVEVGTDEVVDFALRVKCDNRSFHDFVFRDDLRVESAGVVDPDLTDNTRSFTWTVPVFEPADLAVTDMGIRCGERRAGPTTFRCTVRTDIANFGPAAAVATATTVTLGGPADCSFVPSDGQRDERVLASGEHASFVTTWDVTCLSPVRHSVVAEAVIEADEPHAEDRNLANNRGAVRWVPIDVKPRSDPSSVNTDKQGLVPVAVLSTPHFDAAAEVVVDSLRFGRTGEEDSLHSCSATPEDVNDDGFADVVCHFVTTDTGLRCGDTEAVLTGRLANGTAFEGQDAVKIVPCNR